MAAGARVGQAEMAHGFISLKEHNAATLVAGGQVVARLVEFDRRYDVGWIDALVAVLVREAIMADTNPL